MDCVRWVVLVCVVSTVANALTTAAHSFAKSTFTTSTALRSTPSSPEEQNGSTTILSSLSSSDRLRRKADDLLSKAKALRQEIPSERQANDDMRPGTGTASTTSNVVKESPWKLLDNVLDDDAEWIDYRLYMDIGREEGTWMDPRWGASGKRIEFSLDVRFRTDEPGGMADRPTIEGMVNDNFGGISSPTYVVHTAPFARLRQGFDRMKCQEGAYRVDLAKNGCRTIRFYVRVDGTPEKNSAYGDISVPHGRLFFSLPIFGSSVSQLSIKEGPVTVRQVGWHTGWRREESRIVGVFRAVPIADARKRDAF